MVSKKIVRKLHLWLGLSSGIIVCLLCLSGATFVFAEEIMHAYNKENLYVEVEGKRVEIDSIVAKFKKNHPTEQYFWINTYNNPKRSFDVVSGVMEEGASMPILKITFINPYTNKEIADDAKSIHFFFLVAHFHSQLLLGNFGLWIIRIASLIFLVELIFGLVLWWPKSKNEARSAFKPKYPASRKRMNHDFHRVYGFYACWLLLISVVTGLVMSFEWVEKPVIALFGGYSELVGENPPQADFNENKQFKSLQFIYNEFEKTAPKDYKLTLMAIQEKMPTSQLILLDKGNRFLHLYGDNQVVDRYTGVQLDKPLIAKFEKNQSILDTNLDIHMGTIGGLPTQILALLIGLFGASLPITGFFIWWGRRKKLKKEK
ncbi:PepSY-associated TM helix domain-containing protein [Polaribacter cellanae]|uniref:PepSY domain-containing protein n=1 Tax=Polaribacter cellanae TaxID=2818493 RepID=A0A975CRB1_9FLAO|nr:PepSY-associated TM helix domain-containing protein [Polaribacter cellanae]QTE23920.1 PepSY domain-containing protein [Polaribacter cellanae]